MTITDGRVGPDPLWGVVDARHDFAIRLIAYEPDGKMLGVMPEPLDVKVSYPLSELPALTFQYRKDAPGAEFLLRNDGLEVATELYVPRTGKWIEPINGRFVVLDWEEDVTDESNIIKITAPGYGWLLSKVTVHKRGVDDRLRKAEERAIEREDAAKRAYDSAQTSLNSAVTSARNEKKMNGNQYILHYLPSTVNKKRPKHRSVMWHTGGRRFYWYSSKTRKWYRLGVSVDALNRARTAHSQVNSTANTYKLRKRDADKARKSAIEVTKNHKRPMVDVTAGQVMRRLINEGKNRTRGRLMGMLTGFNSTFSSASDGRPAPGNEGKAVRRKWSRRFTVEFTTGQTYLDVLNDLTEMGEVEWFFHRRELMMYRPGDLGVKLTRQVALQLGIGMSEAPDRASRRDFANYLHVRGQEHKSFGMWNDQKVAQTGWGVWEKSVAISGIDGTAAMKRAALKEARDALKRVKVESTRGLELGTYADFRPMYDYLPGQYIMAYASNGVLQQYRVMGITLSFDNDQGVSGNIVLGDKFMQNVLNFRQSMARTVGGYEKTIGGGTVPLLPPVEPIEEEEFLPAPLLAASVRAGVNRLTGRPSTIVNLAWQVGEDLPDAVPVTPEEEAEAEQEAPAEAY